jgi:uncharacterized protein (TIGR03083 family)
MSAGEDAAVPLSTEEHIERLGVEGRRFGEVVARTPFDARVPGCPDWTVEDLVRHLGDVHRWAGTIVRERRQERLRLDFEGPPGHADLLAWYTQGHAELLQALSEASPADEFWAWAPAPNAQAFWARRQAHETAIHRLDAEQAAGSATPFTTAQAADGVDEWLTLAQMRCKVPDGGGRTLHFAALDLRAEWVVELRDGGITLRRGEAGGDCTVRAPASDLFALVMNRREVAGLTVEGDSDLLRVWRHSVRF